MTSRPGWFSLALAALALMSCGRSTPAASPMLAQDRGRAAPAAPAAAPHEAHARQALVPVRKIIRTGEIMLLVDSLVQARQAIETAAEATGGYVASAQANQSGDPSAGASSTLVLRVPAGRFDQVERGLGRLGSVLHESLAAEEISEQYYDLAARLGNARRLEQRLLELMARQTSKMSDLLEAEGELARVRGEIEQLEGKQRLWDHQVALATLTVQLVVKRPELAAATLTGELRSTFGGSWQTLTATGRGLLLLIVALAPWLPLLAGASWLLVRLVRGLRRRSRALAEITPGT